LICKEKAISFTYLSLKLNLNLNLSLTLKMHNLTGTTSTSTPFAFQMPSNWDELEPLQTAYILETLSYSKADPYTLKMSVMVLVCGVKNFKTLTQIAEEDLYTIFNLVDWVFTTRPPAINKFPSININKKTYVSASNTLGNMCFGEWCFAYEFYSAFHKHNDHVFLHKLIATLYRQPLTGISTNSPDYNGDLRPPFNENQIEIVAKGVSAIQENIQHTILTWFTSAILDIMEKRPHVFPKTIPPDPNEEEDQPQPEPEQSHRTWLTIFRELLGPKFGTETQLKYTNAIFVLDYLEEQHINFEEASKNL
jgi:hypothetical protein